MRMATYASRPAWELRARAVSGARVAVPLGLGALRRRLRSCCARASSDVGFWIDEGLSVGIADRPLGDIPGVLRQDGSPPLYYVLLHSGCRSRATRRTSAHALSLLFAALCVPVAFWAGRPLFGRRTAWIGRAARGRQPVPDAVRAGGAHVRARALLGLVALTLLAAGVHDRRRTTAPARRRAIGFAVALAAMLYTHNWALLLRRGDRASRGSCCCWRARPPSAGGCCAPALLAYGGALLLYLPWLPDRALPGRPHGRAVVARAVARGARLGARRGCSGTSPRSRSLLAAGAGLVALLRARAGARRPRDRRAAA